MSGAGELQEEEESGLPGEAEPLQHAHTHRAGDVLQSLSLISFIERIHIYTVIAALQYNITDSACNTKMRSQT